MDVSVADSIQSRYRPDALCSTPSADARMPLSEPKPGQESLALTRTPARDRQERASADLLPRSSRAETYSEEIIPSRRGKPGEPDSRNGFQPLSTLPQDVPRRWRSHWLKLADRAKSSYRATVELKCLDCCAWQRTEARRCEIRGCPLLAVNTRIFQRVRGAMEQPQEGAD
jgi:hypothetical protein